MQSEWIEGELSKVNYIRAVINDVEYPILEEFAKVRKERKGMYIYAHVINDIIVFMTTNKELKGIQLPYKSEENKVEITKEPDRQTLIVRQSTLKMAVDACKEEGVIINESTSLEFVFELAGKFEKWVMRNESN